MTTIPAYTIGGLTRPELQLDSTGHIVLDSAAQAFADTYGLQYLYLGCPPGTPWPPVTDSLSSPVDANSGNNTVIEGAAANTLVNITAQAVSSSGNPVTYSLAGDTSGGGFKIDPNTGVVSVADPTKVNYVTSPGHAYTITVQASDGIATSSQSFTIGVTDVAPSTPVDSNAAPNKVAEGAAAGTLVGITASSTDMNAVTYSLTGDSSGGGFKIDPHTGVITVADPSKIDYSTAPGHAYSVTATASGGTLSSSQTFSIAVTLGAATHFVVNIPANSAAGTPGTVTVTALDALNHVVTNYTGTVHFTSSDGHAVLPADVTLTNGTGSFSETLETSGSQTITATDTVDHTIAGTSNAETVTPGAATHLSVSLAANGTAGTPGSVVVTALDAFGNVATGYSGTVHFTSSDGSAVLPADATLINGVGTFSETFDTAGHQTITATDTVSAAITGTSNAETVSGGAATHFVVSIPANGAAGTPGTVTVTALDAFGNVATGYSGTLHFTSSDGHAVLPANMTLTNGIGTFSETFETVGSQTITATDTVNAAITGTSNTETVTPGPATRFTVSIPANGTAGTPGSGTVTALDAGDNIVTGYSGTVHFTSTDGHAVLPADMTLTNGVGTFSETLDTSGSQTITATDTVQSAITGTSNAETVTAAAVTHFAVAIPANGTAGTAGSGTVTALDAFGNVVNGYTGTVHFTSSDGSAVLPADMTLTNGVASFSETLDTAGSQTITATDTVAAAITGTSNAETVAPGAATHFVVSIPANGRADIPGSITVTALDAHNNVATGYSGTVHFTSSDGSAVLPSDMTLTNGTGTFSETFGTAGSQTITATDTVNAGITGTSNAETVAPPDAPPVVTGGHTLNYIEGQAATAFDPALTVTDADNATLDHVTVQITGNYFNGQDILGFVNTANITGAWDVAHGELTLTGTAASTVADFQAALDSITYLNTSSNPSGLARTVTIIANDGALDGTPATDTINVTPVNNPPVISFGAITGFTEPPNGTPAANSTPVTLAPNLTITDAEGNNLTDATFVLNDLKPSDALSIAGHAGSSGDIGGIHFDITSTAGTETISFTGTDTLAHYNAALDLIQFNNTSENPDTTARSYTLTVHDDGGTANGGNDTGTASTTGSVTAVDDAPTATVPADNSIGTAFSHTNLAISGLSVADVDSDPSTVTATISTLHANVSFDTSGLASFTNNNSHTVTLTGTIAQVNTALATLTYNSDDGFSGTDTVTLNVNDNGHTGTGGPLSSGNQTFHVGVVPQVFYIDNSAAGSHNLGTQADPYTSIAAFNAANPAGSGDYVVLEHGTGTYSEANGINLASGVNLIGGSHTLQFTNPVTGAVVTANTGSGTDPVIHVTGADSGIDLVGGGGHLIENISIDTSASTGAGISDDGNNVGTVSMSDIVIKTASGAGMNFTHGGTITLTGAANSITSTTGTALDVVNTNIGSAGLTFHDISANGAANGIILNNTGTGAGNGGLTVTGDGATAGSGGTIQNNVQGALFTNTKALSLSYMNFTNPDSGNGTAVNADDSTFNSNADAGINMSNVAGVTLDHLNVNGNGGSGGAQNGINGVNVSNLTISNSTVVGFGDDDGANNAEGNVRLFNLSGTSNITNSTFGFVPGDTSGGDNLVDIRNTTGTLTLNVTGSTFHNTADSTSGADGLQVTSNSSSVINLNVSGSTFTNLKTAGIDTFARDSSTMNVNITDGGVPGSGNSFTPGTVASRAVGLNAEDTAHLNFNINRNIAMVGYGGPVVEIFGINSAVINGHVDDNTNIANNGTTNRAGSPLDFDIEDNATASIEASGNTINNAGQDAGIVAFAEGDGGTTNNKAALDLTLANNLIAMTGNNLNANSFNDGILLVPGANANDATTITANVHNNAVTGVTAGDGNVAFVVENSGGAGSHLYLENFAGSTNATWNANNNTPQNSTLELNSPASTAIPGTHNGGHTILPSNGNALFSADGGVASASGSTGEMNLTQAELNKVVAAAIASWTAAGLSSGKVALLQHVTYDVADITSGWLGQSTPGHVTIDVNADGRGWFIDPTPSDNSEFAHAVSATTLVTDPTTAAAGHMDLLTTVVHEMGEQLGLQDLFAPADQGSLMYAFLATGERQLPTKAEAAQANAAAELVMPTQGITSATGTASTSRDSFDFSGFTQTSWHTDTGHVDLGTNTQTLSDLFSEHSNAAAPWWVGHETVFAAMGGTPTDNHSLLTHHDLVI